MNNLNPLIAYDDEPVNDTVHQPFAAFNQGWDAADSGYPMSLCPYFVGTTENRYWKNGYIENTLQKLKMMKLHKYDSKEQYRKTQIEANKRKIDWVWVKESSIKLIVEYLKYHDSRRAKYGEPGWDSDQVQVLCHGTRNGKEQKYFRKHLKEYNPFVLGTEISPTADQFPYTIQWDFHDQNKEWIGRFDIVYSNALDHSHSPKECVQTWLDQLNEDGLLFVEWSKDNLKSNAVNPFSGTPEEWEAMFPVVDKISGEGTVIFVMK